MKFFKWFSTIYLVIFILMNSIQCIFSIDDFLFDAYPTANIIYGIITFACLLIYLATIKKDRY